MTAQGETASKRSKNTINFSRLFERYALLLVWALLIIGFSIAMPNSFMRWGNFSILFASYAPAALLALAIIIPLTSGDYDLAVGATMTLSSCLIAVLNAWNGVSIEISILLALLSGVAIGLFHALFIVYFRIPSLVVTLGSTSLMSGIVQWFTNSSTIGGIDNALIMAVVGGRLFGVPYAFYYALGAAVVMWYIFDFTPVGRRLLFVGRGREVARLNGIAVERVRVGALVMSSVVAAAAGVLYACSVPPIPIRASTTFYPPSRRRFSARPRSCPAGSIRGERSSQSISWAPVLPA